MVKTLPSVIEILSYSFYCQTAALGVFFEFRDYKRFIEKTEEYANIPNPILPSLVLLAKSIAFSGILVLGSAHFSVEGCWSDRFLEFSYLGKIAYMTLTSCVKRCFYYAPFHATNGAIIACGHGYNGIEKTEKKDDEKPTKKPAHRWDKIVAVFFYNCETTTSPMDFF